MKISSLWGPSTNWQSKLRHEDSNGYIWWRNFRRLVDFFGLGPWCMVKFVVEYRWVFWKRKMQANKISPILRRKLRRRLILYISLRKNRRKFCRQNFASKSSPTNFRQLFFLHLTINRLPLWGLTETWMLIGVNQETIEQKWKYHKVSLPNFLTIYLSGIWYKDRVRRTPESWRSRHRLRLWCAAKAPLYSLGQAPQSSSPKLAVYGLCQSEKDISAGRIVPNSRARIWLKFAFRIGFGFISLGHVDMFFLSFFFQSRSFSVYFLLETGMQIHISPLPALQRRRSLLFVNMPSPDPTPFLHAYREATLPDICAA